MVTVDSSRSPKFPQLLRVLLLTLPDSAMTAYSCLARLQQLAAFRRSHVCHLTPSPVASRTPTLRAGRVRPAADGRAGPFRFRKEATVGPFAKRDFDGSRQRSGHRDRDPQSVLPPARAGAGPACHDARPILIELKFCLPRVQPQAEPKCRDQVTCSDARAEWDSVPP